MVLNLGRRAVNAVRNFVGGGARPTVASAAAPSGGNAGSGSGSDTPNEFNPSTGNFSRPIGPRTRAQSVRAPRA
jgi:hypothetical protein